MALWADLLYWIYPNQTTNVEFTNRNSFMSLNKVWLSIQQFSRNFRLNKVLWTSSVPKFYLNQNKNIEIMDKTSPIPISKIWLSLHQISWNSQVLKGIRLRSSVSNFIQIGHKIWKSPLESHICPSVISVTVPILEKFKLTQQLF